MAELSLAPNAVIQCQTQAQTGRVPGAYAVLGGTDITAVIAVGQSISKSALTQVSQIHLYQPLLPMLQLVSFLGVQLPLNLLWQTQGNSCWR